MKKTILKLLAGTMLLSTVGAGTGTAIMAFDDPLETSWNAERIDYQQRDGYSVVTPWFDGIPGAPMIILDNNQSEEEISVPSHSEWNIDAGEQVDEDILATPTHDEGTWASPENSSDFQYINQDEEEVRIPTVKFSELGFIFGRDAIGNGNFISNYDLGVEEDTPNEVDNGTQNSCVFNIFNLGLGNNASK